MALFLPPGFYEQVVRPRGGIRPREAGATAPAELRDQPPYGFMGKYQADRCEGQAVWQVTRKVTDWLVKTSTARTALAEAVTGALERSPSWDTTRKIMSVLVNLPTFTTDELVRLDQAARSNGEVRDAFFESGSAPDRIKMLIEERGGLPPGPPSDEAPF